MKLNKLCIPETPATYLNYVSVLSPNLKYCLKKIKKNLLEEGVTGLENEKPVKLK